MKKRQYFLIFWLELALSGLLAAQTNIPEAGTYDGKIGNDRIILIVESSDPAAIHGYFVGNHGKAVETSHTFLMPLSETHPVFQSDQYVGKLKSAKINSSSLQGKLALFNKKKIFFFFRPKVQLSLLRRADIPFQPGYRYQKEIFGEITVRSNIIYGKANGYWTSSPYTDDPYIEVLAKGLVKTFRDNQPLDLKMDLYSPKADTLSNRPLVMLIHGGAFFVGSKEAATERTLATALARRGYVVASIDYRLGFKPVASDLEMSGYRAIQDAHAALRYLSHYSKDFGINPNRVYVGGTSAGAIASLNVAFMDNSERPPGILKAEKEGLVGKIEESGNSYTDTFEIKGVANLWGAVGNLKIISREENIPVLSIHGTADKIVPFDYNHPFQNSLGINRLLTDKMYGSKPIHEWLQALGIRNLLVPLKGLGHEPELEGSDTLNGYMDTLISRGTQFFYEETAPAITVLPDQLVISENARLKPVPYLIRNGSVSQIVVEGGVKASPDPANATVIWLKNAEKRKLVFISSNPFDAWNIKSFPVTVVQ
jgi:pimeloyl-ACP methyl ester carboxylesterase